MTTNDLLRRYVADQSEAAFAELVQQHIALVYSSALRQVNGDVPAAQDVTQAVFTDLARKAPGLTRHTSLTGWLYTSTRFLASKARRAEQSRRSREQEAHDMNQLLNSSGPDTTWQELRPMLDEAMHDLSATDREAVLLRYFERLPLVEVGARLGLTDKAAHMRVERAIDRLRAALAKRGVTSTITALAAVLTARAVGTVPAGLAVQVSQAALATVGAGGALGWGLLKLAGLLKAPAAIALGAVAVVAGLIVTPHLLNKDHATTASPIQAQLTPAVTNSKPVAEAPATVTAATTASNMMLLHIVADDTGLPIPGAVIYGPARRAGRGAGPGPGNLLPPTKLATADQFGTCEIPSITQDSPGWLMFFTSTTNGYVDEQAIWNPNIGKVIPSQYTLRLEKAVSIGGLVLDEEDQPVAGAAIIFDEVTRGKPDDGNPETPRLSYMVGIAPENGGPSAVTDATGHWHSEKVSREDVAKIAIRATHSDFIVEGMRNFRDGEGPEAEKLLLAGDYPYKLTRGLRLTGVIVDTDGRPVPAAQVTCRPLKFSLQPNALGRRPSSGQSPPPVVTTNQADGTFIFTGCWPGTNHLIVEAPNFAYTTLDVNLATDTAPLRLVLQPGYVLRLRVLDTNGLPFPPRANPNVVINSSSGTAVRGFNANSNTDGRVVWESTPDREMRINVHAQGMTTVTNLLIPADGEEHLVTLTPGESAQARAAVREQLIVSGTVTDAATSLPIPRFRLIKGYPAFGTNVNWSAVTIFADGKFSYDRNTLAGGRPEDANAVNLKFEADGYAPFVTRSVRDDEGDVTLNIALQPASSISINILSPDGRPAGNANVGLVRPGNPLKISPGAMWHATPAADVNVFRADDQGRVTLPPDSTVVRVIAVSEDGYGEATAAALNAQPTLRLQPWGRLEGDYLVGGNPAPGRALALVNRKTPESLQLDETDYATKTDASGRFSFPKVPPGQFQLFGSNVVVHSGETTTVALRANTVSVRLRWPEGVQQDSNWVANIGLFSGFEFKETPEGNWTAELPPGRHQANAYVSAPPPPGSSRPGVYILIFQGEKSFTVPADPASGTLDLGELQLQKAQ